MSTGARGDLGELFAGVQRTVPGRLVAGLGDVLGDGVTPPAEHPERVVEGFETGLRGRRRFEIDTGALEHGRNLSSKLG